MYHLSFFVVLGLGLWCTAFAKSLALALDGFDLYTVHELSSNEKDLGRKISLEKISRQRFEPGPLGAKQERYPFVLRGPPPFELTKTTG